MARAKNWLVGVLLSTIYSMLSVYLLCGVARCIGVLTLDESGIEKIEWLDTWWIWVVDGLRTTPIPTVLMILTIMYTVVGVIRMTLALFFEDDQKQGHVISYRALLDLWWSEVYYWIFHREPFRC